MSVFLGDGEVVFPTYSSYGRATDLHNTAYLYLDLTAVVGKKAGRERQTFTVTARTGFVTTIYIPVRDFFGAAGLGSLGSKQKRDHGHARACGGGASIHTIVRKDLLPKILIRHPRPRRNEPGS